MRRTFALLAFLLLAPLVALHASNLLPNSSFEEGEGDTVKGWKSRAWAGKGEASWRVESSGRTGKRCVSIGSGKGTDAAWTTTVTVKSNTVYRLSGWIKTEDVRGASGALLNIQNMQEVMTAAVSGTRDWTRVSTEFQSGAAMEIEVNCLFGGWGVATGQAWYDDIALEQVDGPLGPGSIENVVIDVKERGAVISPLLFGHNMETTRDSVWRGLGAEMVANRKFAVAKNGLPARWTVMGDGVKVAIDDRRGYAGKQSVRVEILDAGKDCGIAQTQEVMAFLKDAKYVLRMWIRSDAPCPVRARIVDMAGNRVLLEKEWHTGKGDWELFSGDFTAPSTSDKNRLEISGVQAGVFWIGAVSLQPADAFHGMRRDVVELLKRIKPGALRWPGGCYAEFYRWQDGLLPVDQRPPIGPTGLWFLLNSSDDSDPHEIGIDEFMALCREIGCEPAITIRLSETAPEDGSALVEYCNGSPRTDWGKIRAGRGHEEPYAVKTWFLGNELWSFGRGGMNNANNCAKQTRLFADAIRKVDSSVRLVACTDLVNGRSNQGWNTALLAQAGEQITYVSCHDYMRDSFKPRDLQSYARASTAYLRPAFQRFRQDPGRPIIFDEWNTMWGQKGSVGMGLYAAGVLNLLCREADALGVASAYYFMPVNEGAIKVGPLTAELDTAGKVFAAFQVHQGNRVLKVPEVTTVADIDTCASVQENGQRVFISIINRSTAQDHAVSLTLKNMCRSGKAAVRFLAVKGMKADETAFEERDVTLVWTDGTFLVNMPRCSIAVVEVVGDE